MPQRTDGLRTLLVLVTALTLGVLVATGVAVGQDAATEAPAATAAAGERSAIRAGVRNPRGSRRDELREETQIIADTGRDEYGTRQSNKGAGGGAIYGCRSRLDTAELVDPRRSTPCIRASNLSNGEAFQFTSDGVLVGVLQVGDTFAPNTNARPFITNARGVATGLNADEVDGQSASEIIATARAKQGLSADDAARLEGQPASAFESSDTLRTRGVTVVREGATEELFRHGPFTVSGRCRDDAGDTTAEVLLSTSEDDSVAAGDGIGPAGDADLDAAESPVVIDAGASDPAAGAGPTASEGYDDQFTGFAPSGRAFSAVASSVADTGSQTCRFHGNLTVNG